MSHELKVERTFDASTFEVFDAYVDPDTQRELYADDETPIVELEEFGHPRVGSRWTISFGASKDAMYRETSVFEVVERPGRLVSTSSMTMLDGTVLQTKFELTLQERDGKTLVTMVMSGFPNAEVRDTYSGGLPGFLDRFEGAVSARDALKSRHDTER